MLDTDNTFSVPHLVRHLNAQQQQQQQQQNPAAQPDDDQFPIPTAATEAALKHIHILRPQTLGSAIATLSSLPTYLFDGSRHHSFDQPVAFVALASASAFYWQTKAEEEDASLLATTATTTAGQTKPRPIAQWNHLAASLRRISNALACPVMFTSWNMSPPLQPQQQGYRPNIDGGIRRSSVPAPLAQLPVLKLVVQRESVRKFPVGMSLEEAKREAGVRWKAVQGSRIILTNGADGEEVRFVAAGMEGGGAWRTDEDG
jgi:hypothetical protein